MKSVKKSDFSGLAKYITEEQGKNERVGYLAFTNCEAQNFDGVVAEILATQHLNTRSESDKTYHLIISFRAGEQPGGATIQAIEARICEGLGFGEHQRVSAAHHDTDNLHLHIAINKIHPIRHTIHNPYYDHKMLSQLCEKLEKEYGLEPDNHRAQKLESENRAADMENHAGIESLLGWIKRECKEQITGAKSWSELHQVMQENGLELRERGNGFVVTSGDGIMVKASSIDRDLSKGKLEVRFGPFKPSPEHQARTAQKPEPIKQYKAQPMRSNVNTVELYAKYKYEQQNLSVLRTSEWTKARERKNNKIEAVKKSGRLKRTGIKHMVEGGMNKKILYSTTSKTLKDDIKRINDQYEKERKLIYEQCKRQAWADWLRAKATDGDQEALNALRAREAAQGLKGNTVTGKGRQVSSQSQGQDSITKKGTIIHRGGTREDGSKLKVSKDASQEGLQTALKMAMDRYGNRIAVNGTAEFKEQIAQAAAAANLPVTFDDAALERRRQELLQAQENSNGRFNTAAGRRRSNSGSNGGAGLASARDDGPSRVVGRNRQLVPGGGIPGKPDVGRVGRKPPPESQNRLRGLSELGVVRIAERSEVLLPGDVSNHVEQQEARPLDSLRRDLLGARGGVDSGLAADKYIKEREEKRLKSFDILKHSRYNYSADEVIVFAGIRQVDGQTLALLKSNDEIMVLPIDAATMTRLKRISIGDTVTVTPKGVIKTKGKSR